MYNNVYLAGHQVGGMDYRQLRRFFDNKLARNRVSFIQQGNTKVVSASESGLRVSDQAIQNAIAPSSTISSFRPWFISQRKSLEVSVNTDILEKTLDTIQPDDYQVPTDAEFILQNGNLTISPSVPGYGIDQNGVINVLIKHFSHDFADVQLDVPTKVLQPEIPESLLRQNMAYVQQRITTNYRIQGKSATKTAEKQEVLGWLTAESTAKGVIMGVDDKVVSSWIDTVAEKLTVPAISQVTSKYLSGKASQITTRGQAGYSITNSGQISRELTIAVQKGITYIGDFKYEVVPFDKKIITVDDLKPHYTYDIAVWGNVNASISEFKALAQQTLTSSKGWSRGVSFSYVPTGGDFTLVLAEPSRVASAGVICDAYYSCRVGRYAIINDDRWRSATPTWNNAGGSLRDYRHMVVNHEVGHWLGFGHRYCASAGQLAPVMQQQSISLQGCAINPWPTSSEIADL